MDSLFGIVIQGIALPKSPCHGLVPLVTRPTYPGLRQEEPSEECSDRSHSK